MCIFPTARNPQNKRKVRPGKENSLITCFSVHEKFISDQLVITENGYNKMEEMVSTLTCLLMKGQNAELT